MNEKTILINDLPVSYVEYSSDSVPLLFLHGWGQSKETFRGIYNILEMEGISYYGIDLPGFGKTPRPSFGTGIYEYAGLVEAFLQKKNIKKNIIVGHSFGGRIGIILAGRQAIGLERLVLIGSAGILPRKTTRQKMLSLGARVFFTLPGSEYFREFLRKRFSSHDDRSAGALRDVFRKVITEDLEPLLKQIKIPTLLLWGTLDRETPLQDAQRMKANIPNSKLKIYPEGTHFVYLEHTEEITEDILSFIRLESHA